MRALKVALLGAALLLSGCGYNTLQQQDEAVKAAWSEVLSQYQRRADLIPNLVETVKGFAAQEQTVLIGVTEARAKAGSIQLTPELLNDEAAMRKFQEAQGGLTQALKSLFAVTENYPELKSDQNLPSTCRRSSKARKTASRWRASATSRPCRPTTPPCVPSRRNLTAMMFKHPVKPNFHGRERGGDFASACSEFGLSAPATGCAARGSARSRRSQPR